jgi:hypothetical protein
MRSDRVAESIEHGDVRANLVCAGRLAWDRRISGARRVHRPDG